jgi:hypothetical protein
MKNFISLFFFISFFTMEFSNAFGQYNIMPKRPYEPIVFENLEPVWYETLFDTTFIGGDTCDGYNLFERSYFADVVFEDTYLYKINHKFGTTQYNGTYIEKRNFVTGQIIWRNYYGLPVDKYQEFGRVLFINEKNQLEVLSQLKTSPYADTNDYLISFDNCLLTKRIYDKHSGALLSAELPDISDSTLLRTTFSMWQNSDEFFIAGPDSFIYYRFHNILPKTFHFEHQLAKIGYNNKNESLKFNSIAAIDLTTQEFLIQLDSNTNLLVEADRNKGKAVLRYTDNFLNLKEEFYSDSISYHLNGLSFKSYDPINESILLINSDMPTGFGQTAYEVIILDKKGKILTRARLPNHYSRRFEFLTGNDHSEIRLMASGFDVTERGRIFTFLDILTINKNGEINMEKRFPVIDSLRFLANFQLFLQDDEHFLIHWWERSYFYNNNNLPQFDIKSSAMAWLKLRKTDLFPVNTEDFQLNLLMDVFPNPASEKLHIVFDQEIIGNISIHDIHGKYLDSKKIQNQKNIELDVSNLHSGAYVLYFEPNDIKNRQKIRAKTFYKK